MVKTTKNRIKTKTKSRHTKKNKLHNNIVLIKKIGEGWAGAVYKCKVGNIFGIYKIEKNDDFNNGYKSSYIRQIDFSNNLGNNYPDRFLTLEQSGIVFNCNYTSLIPENMPKYLQQEKIKSNKIKTCSFLIYTPILDGTLYDIINKLTLTEYKYMVNYIFDSIEIMHNNGYYHRDIHVDNIMYKKENGKYKWYIIDYGLIYHKKYPNNNTDKLAEKKYWANDKIAFIHSILKRPIFDLIEKENMWGDIKNFDDRVKYIKQSRQYDDIKKYIPIGLTPKEIDEIIIIITIILHNNIYIESLGLNYEKYKDYDVSQVDTHYLLGLLKKI